MQTTQEPKTKCSSCGKECNEIFMKPHDDSEYDKIVVEDDRRIGYKYTPDGGTEVNPYVDGGTFVSCGNCALYTFYPRKPKSNDVVDQILDEFIIKNDLLNSFKLSGDLKKDLEN